MGLLNFPTRGGDLKDVYGFFAGVECELKDGYAVFPFDDFLADGDCMKQGFVPEKYSVKKYDGRNDRCTNDCFNQVFEAGHGECMNSCGDFYCTAPVPGCFLQGWLNGSDGCAG